MIWMLRFISYLGHGTVEGFFTDENRARVAHERALAMRNEISFRGQDHEPPMFVPFSITDDFNVTVAVNLINSVILFGTQDDLERRNAAIRRGYERAEGRYSSGRNVGFTPEKNGED